MKSILAIDPGASGGFAWNCDRTLLTMPMPKTDAEIVEQIRYIVFNDRIDLVVVEDPPKFCGRSLPASSIFVMAYNYGLIVGCLIALSKPIVRVRPQTWQVGIGSTRKQQGSRWKAYLKSMAQERHPTATVTLSTADALLIHNWAQRTNQ